MSSDSAARPLADTPAVGDDAADRATIARLTSEVVPMLIERLARSELGELEVREHGWRVRLRQAGALDGHAADLSRAGAAQASAHRPTQSIQHESRGAQRDLRRDVITSPAVGYFSSRDGVQAGHSLRKGDVIGHVDVLGVKVEVVSDHDGKLAKLDVQPGQAVEYGEAIARLEPAQGERTGDV